MERLRLRNLHPAKRHDRSVFLALWYRLFSICDRGPTLKRIDACLRHDAASFLLPARAPSLSLARLRAPPQRQGSETLDQVFADRVDKLNRWISRFESRAWPWTT